jgi:carbonic anhydrase
LKALEKIFKSNTEWSQKIKSDDSGFFQRLAEQQSPKYLWIGCSDSRVPATQICGLDPGEIFVHRNIANIVNNTDLNCLSVLQYAVEVLKVEHIIVCGHYGCGGVNASMQSDSFGLLDNWLKSIKDVYHNHQEELEVITDQRDKQDRLTELNVTAQVANLCHTSIVQDAWAKKQELFVHGWVYGLENGLLKDLDLCINSYDQLPEIYQVNK